MPEVHVLLFQHSLQLSAGCVDVMRPPHRTSAPGKPCIPTPFSAALCDASRHIYNVSKLSLSESVLGMCTRFLCPPTAYCPTPTRLPP